MTRLREILPDALLLVGLAIIAYGVWMIYPPAAWIVAGIGVMAYGLALAAIQARKGD